MSCDQCHEREAVIHLTQIVNEQVTTLHLCERCAAEKGVESTATVEQNPFAKLVAASMGKASPDLTLVGSGTRGACPRCGATLQDFRESGRLGCADCWRAFEAPLRDLLRRLHGSTVHMGERYAERNGEAVRVNGDSAPHQADLREQLRLAIETENFELAAELRDRLRVLE
ncbi:MAG TPA: UvrB/UvrC motif-containing protein [Gemmatimonadales bacterium]|jgi:protein arginine kinase activator|nr:UvrB/UvrC motif-containing protein [Gemmatimonadales bacterium]